jgi:SNF2 family DNA or RNA helicase
MEYKAHRYQAYATEQIVENESFALFLEMGLGKTAATLTAINELMYDYFTIRKVLVIAPLRVAEDTWLKEKDKWDHTKHLTVSRVLGTATERIAALKAKADIYVINRENVVWLVERLGSNWDFDMLVIDELSSFKSNSAKRFRALRKVRPLCKRVVGLTGTPASNGYMDLWPEIYLLDRGQRLGKTLTAYRDNYFRPGARNGHIVYEWVLKPDGKERIDAALQDICVSMKSADWLDMPPRVDIYHTVTMDKAARKKYDTFMKDHVLEGLDGEDIYGLSAASVTNKLLQMANGFVYDENKLGHNLHDLKLDALEEIIEASQGQPVMVFYSYIEDRERILKKFPKAGRLLESEDITEWNAGKTPILVCHPASAGHGLNLQDGGNTIVWYGMPWSLELYQQANARLHRQGQTKTVFVHHILCEDTVDQEVVKALASKDFTQEGLLAAVKAWIGGRR